MKSSGSAEAVMGAAPGAAGKRRGGRRGKLTWRKNVDIADVEHFLEEQRLEERLGATANKSDAELFVVDTAGEEHLQNAPHLTTLPVLSTKQRRRALLAAPPRCYSNLENTSRVPDPSGPRNTVRPVGTGPRALAPRSRERRLARGTVARREQHRQQEGDKLRQRRKRARTSRQRFDMDVWTQELCEKRVEPSLCTEWLEPAAVEHHTPPARRVARPATPASRPVPPPVPAPHPGQSYNPSYLDHQVLLSDIGEKEKLLMKKEKHLERVTSAMYKRVRPDQAQSEWVKEMMSGLPEVSPAAPADDAESGSDGEYRSVNPPVRNKKKADKARRKQKEHKQELQEAARRKQDKKKIADIYKLRFLEAALSRAEARLERVRSARASRRSARLAAVPPTLNAHKHLPHDPAFLAPHELAPALRQHMHTGNLLRERWESLQRRGAVAPSRIFLRKKLRMKTYWKPGHKVSPQDVDKFLSKRDKNKTTLQ